MISHRDYNFTGHVLFVVFSCMIFLAQYGVVRIIQDDIILWTDTCSFDSIEKDRVFIKCGNHRVNMNSTDSNWYLKEKAKRNNIVLTCKVEIGSLTKKEIVDCNKI